ncbi:hypothetical protein AVEN_1302-1, partial [Araneus ventricosus]
MECPHDAACGLVCPAPLSLSKEGRSHFPGLCGGSDSLRNLLGQSCSVKTTQGKP